MLIIPVSGKPHTDCLCVVCLRGEDLVLLLSVRLAPVANFNNYEFLSVITDNQLSYVLCLLLVILSFMYF